MNIDPCYWEKLATLWVQRLYPVYRRYSYRPKGLQFPI